MHTAVSLSKCSRSIAGRSMAKYRSTVTGQVCKQHDIEGMQISKVISPPTCTVNMTSRLYMACYGLFTSATNRQSF